MGITLSCFEEIGDTFNSSLLVPLLLLLLFTICEGDPDDKWIGMTLSLRAVSQVVVVAITVGGLAELKNETIRL